MSLEQLEELRIKARNRKILIGIISTVVVIGFFILAIILNVRGVGYLGIILSGVIGSALYAPIKNYSAHYKETFVETELKNSFDNLIYQPFEGISKDVISNTGMMPVIDINHIQIDELLRHLERKLNY